MKIITLLECSMNKLKKNLDKNTIIISLSVVSTVLFQYVEIVTALVAIVVSFILFKAYCYLRKYKKIKNIIKFGLISYIIIEFVLIFILFIKDTQLSYVAVFCLIFVSIKMSLMTVENLSSVFKVILIFNIVFILLMFFSFSNSMNKIDFSFDYSISVIFLILSILAINVASSLSFEINNKNINNGFLFGSIIYFIIVLIMNISIGNKYIFNTHPILILSELIPFSILPFPEWNIMTLVCFRESIFLKYILNISKHNLGEKSVE